MNTQLEQIREQQKASWNKFAPGWKKWDEFMMNFMKPMGDEIIEALQLSDTDTILDVAAGTGEPGLTIAAIVKNGKVYITDLAEGMLDVARDNAARKGITNYETVACDVTALPFADETFDGISCRFGFMFFPDMLLAAKEMVRVLKPGGIIATSVWSVPEKNAWITTSIRSVNKYTQLPAPPPGAPGMFRCGSPDFLADLFRQAGLTDVREKEVNGSVRFGSKETYWQIMNDVAAPVMMAMSQADEATKQAVKEDVFDLLDQTSTDSQATLNYSTLVVYGKK